MRNRRVIKKQNKGFTLVELIVVLVILAILAAVLIPALLGYIDSARQKQYLINAKACLTAAQAEFTAAYAKQGDVKVGDPVIPDARVESTSGNEDQDITNTDFAKRVLALVDMTGDKAPYCFMVAVGSNAEKGSAGNYTVTVHDKYTVYYAFYMEKKDSSPCYYYNGSWTQRNPRALKEGTSTVDSATEIFDGYNVVKSGDLKGKRLQYYLISNKTSYSNSVLDGSFWSWLKNMR